MPLQVISEMPSIIVAGNLFVILLRWLIVDCTWLVMNNDCPNICLAYVVF